MGLTEWTKKQTPHLSAVVILGVAAFGGPAGAVLGVECKSMAKDKDIQSPWLELAGAMGAAMSAGFGGLFIWMNQTWGRHLQAREKEHERERERETSTLAAERAKTQAEGHLR